MVTARLSKVGNGQAIYVPKAICDEAGVSVGDDFSVRLVGRSLVITPLRPKHRRLTAAEVFGDWDGTYEPPSDLPANGSEVDSGGPVGGEAW